MQAHPRVLVAMSGGVDSSVTAHLLRQQGCDCIGATMVLSCGDGRDGADGSCGGSRDLDDAEAVCRRLGIPWHALDLRPTFKRAVIDKFVRTYEAGRTPNPCIDCNRHLKFGALLDHALELGCDFVATGHYARTGTFGAGGRIGTDAAAAIVPAPASSGAGDASNVETTHGGTPLLERILERTGVPFFTLACGVDPAKDQSYVLYSLTQERLAHVLLPLGGLMKERDVRRIAREQGFENAGKRDSQGICFVPNDDFAAYIERRHGRALPKGDVLDDAGNVLGRHRGAIRYTVGQRKGLGVAAARPLYVTGIDAQANTVTLGDGDALLAGGLVADDWIWSVPADAMRELLDEAGDAGLPASARIRYHHANEPCRLFFAREGVRMAFDRPVRAIAPGQAVVVYAGQTVLGGGTVLRATE